MSGCPGRWWALSAARTPTLPDFIAGRRAAQPRPAVPLTPAPWTEPPAAAQPESTLVGVDAEDDPRHDRARHAAGEGELDVAVRLHAGEGHTLPHPLSADDLLEAEDHALAHPPPFLPSEEPMAGMLSRAASDHAGCRTGSCGRGAGPVPAVTVFAPHAAQGIAAWGGTGPGKCRSVPQRGHRHVGEGRPPCAGGVRGTGGSRRRAARDHGSRISIRSPPGAAHRRGCHHRTRPPGSRRRRRRRTAPPRPGRRRA